VKHTALWEKFVTSDAKAGCFMQLTEISAVLCNYSIGLKCFIGGTFTNSAKA